MTDSIIILKKDANPKTLKLNEHNFWFSSDKHKSIEKMKAKVEKSGGGFINNHGIVAYDSITKIKLNEKSEKVRVYYPNKKGKEEETELTFEEASTAKRIGEFIGSKTNLQKSIRSENRSKALFMSSLWAIGSAVITAFIALSDDMEVNNDSYSRSARRARSGKAVINLLHDTIGQFGILAIGSIITLYLLYQAKKRFSNPANDVVYE